MGVNSPIDNRCFGFTQYNSRPIYESNYGGGTKLLFNCGAKSKKEWPKPKEKGKECM